MKWLRHRFRTRSIDDCRPVVFNPHFPWWCSGEGDDRDGEYAIIIAYLPESESVIKYWPDAYGKDDTDSCDGPRFSDRFARPSYFVEAGGKTIEEMLSAQVFATPPWRDEPEDGRHG